MYQILLIFLRIAVLIRPLYAKSINAKSSKGCWDKYLKASFLME